MTSGAKGGAKTIVVLGDIAIDWFEEAIPFDGMPSQEAGRNSPNVPWRPGWKRHEFPGGALLAAMFLQQFVRTRAPQIAVYSCASVGMDERIEPDYDLSAEHAIRQRLFPSGSALDVGRSRLVHSLQFLRPFDKKKDPHTIQPEHLWRIGEYGGYGLGDRSWPLSQEQRLAKSEWRDYDLAPPPPCAKWDQPHADIIVIDDANNGFRVKPDLSEKVSGGRRKGAIWPRILIDTDIPDETTRPEVVLKLGRPLPGRAPHQEKPPQGEGTAETFWEVVQKRRAERLARLTVIVSAEDLRHEGVDISYRLSWDQTLEDVREAIQYNPILIELTKADQLLIRFGIDAVILATKKEPDCVITTLICEPSKIEGDSERAIWRRFDDRRPSYVLGTSNAFLAGFVAHKALDVKGADDVEECCRVGLAVARRLSSRGLIRRGTGTRPEYPWESIYPPSAEAPPIIPDEWKDDERFAPFARLAERERKRSVNSTEWRKQLNSLVSFRIEAGAAGNLDLFQYEREGGNFDPFDLASRFVVKGREEIAEKRPTLRIGRLFVTERKEIETYRSISGLIEGHIARVDQGKGVRPLSLAVFGAPGSGKSFGVKEVAREIGGDRIKMIEVNVAQFSSPSDLIGVLHRARDHIVDGDIPLVFFDEFDAAGPSGTPREYLKSFLQPMQDGMFKDGERTHLIDRAIFVYAGGTADSFDDFRRATRDAQGSPKSDHSGGEEISSSDGSPLGPLSEEQRRQKLPDFISRLHGAIDIPSLNPTNGVFPYMRRAIILRSHLEKYARGVFEDPQEATGTVNVDLAVIAAFLRVSSYRHGARSMEAIIRASDISPQTRRLEPSMLPATSLLDIHVDASSFETELFGYVHRA